MRALALAVVLACARSPSPPPAAPSGDATQGPPQRDATRGPPPATAPRDATQAPPTAARPKDGPPAPPQRDTAPPDASAKSCLDRELERRGLNEFGDPPDTVYAGGTPLFDEATGKTRDREEYVRSRHPELAKACPH